MLETKSLDQVWGAGHKITAACLKESSFYFLILGLENISTLNFANSSVLRATNAQVPVPYFTSSLTISSCSRGCSD